MIAWEWANFCSWYKSGDCGELDFNVFLCFCILVSVVYQKTLLFMSLRAVSRESLGVRRSESLGVVPLVEHLPTEELDSVSLLVLWPIFDEGNVEHYPRRWIGLWTEEEDELLSRVLRVCHQAIQRPFLVSNDLSQVGLSIFAVVVRRGPCFGDRD